VILYYTQLLFCRACGMVFLVTHFVTHSKSMADAEKVLTPCFTGIIS